jgi:macrolide transport system ATP-binding/permease protein
MRHTIRSLAKAPTFTIVTVTMLAIGIGANSAAFSVINAILHPEFPYREPDRLAAIYEAYPPNGWTHNLVSPPLWETMRREARSFEAVGASAQVRVSLTESQGARRVQAALVSHDLLNILGVGPQLGRGVRGGGRSCERAAGRDSGRPALARALRRRSRDRRTECHDRR